MGLLTITFNRQQKANALSLAMIRELTDAVRRAGTDAAVRGVLISGAGERAFSGGVDVRETSDLPPADMRRVRSAGFFAALLALVDCEKPVVAAVNGVASGGGFMIAALADVLIAADSASFALPEIDLGTPPLAGLAILAPLLGGAVAYDLVQSARPMRAAEAERHGFVRAVLPRAEVMAHSTVVARELMAKNPRAFAASKAWSRKPLRAALEHAERAMIQYRAAEGE